MMFLGYIKNIIETNIPAKNSAHNTKNHDELNVNPISTKQKLSNLEKDSISSDSTQEYICNKCETFFYKRRFTYSSRF
ncbi:MAG TPA: hypothetical protein VHJ38_02205 [Nitrososphaeraceae archaeon]|jgi:hypothetical protein|nr:hypothetical protein [Nitrososphaeraceae archaeon]